ncbi:DUF3810 domain-containing protein [Rhizosphaericola mali]|nr:DUF3810 domain-containing protein [Rhizosphaericola mali]
MFFAKRKVKYIGILLLIIVILNLWESFSQSIELFYSSSIYKVFSIVERALLGFLPFSFGDIVYTIVILYSIFQFVLFIKNLFKRDWKTLRYKLFILLKSILLLYIFFLLNWGLNYSRLGISYQLKMDKPTYSTIELEDLSKELASKANFYRKQLPQIIHRNDNKVLFQGADSSYKILSEKYSFLKYTMPCVKVSIYSELGNYLGFTGYLDPFTGEAQVNTHTPYYQLPYITCHEIAHQLGYATEDEANFVGYLAASHSNNKLFRYSTYADLFRYAINELFIRDSTKAIPIYKSLDTLVKSDFIASRKFYLPYRNKMERIVTWIYGAYLKANKQPQGIETYNEVVSLLIGYKHKYHQL